MQQYCHSVCERQQQAVHRDQALLQDARQAHSRAASSLTTTAVDTSRLETLKVEGGREGGNELLPKHSAIRTVHNTVGDETVAHLQTMYMYM